MSLSFLVYLGHGQLLTVDAISYIYVMASTQHWCWGQKDEINIYVFPRNSEFILGKKDS